jgi:acyl-CoA dehydrogenase
MSGNDLLAESIDRLLADHDRILAHTSVAGLDEALWNQLVSSGLDRIGLREEAGGHGGDLGDAVMVVSALGRHGAAVPIPETALLSGWILDRADRTLASGISTVVPTDQPLTATRAGLRWRFCGHLERVPWLSVADHVVLIGKHELDWVLAVADPSTLTIEHGTNLAGEPRDSVDIDIELDDVSTITAADVETLRLRTALIRTVQMAGALQTVLKLTIEHVNQREQFGRSLSKFQVVKQQLAEVAGEVAAASGSLAVAVRTVERDDAWLPIGSARARAARAASTATPIVHQLHGALGFTEEHVLHRYTTRLWSWRDESGTQASWERDLGSRIANLGAAALWPLLTNFDTAGSTRRGTE